MQAIYLLALDPVAEVTADRPSFGFRKERSCADAIGTCFNLLARRSSPQWVLEGDIKSCFDRIDHAWLLDHVPVDRGILRMWLKAGYMEQGAFHSTDAGTPQGGIISPVLANLALDGLEGELRKQLPLRRRGGSLKVNLVRYADDFIITGASRELLENEVTPVVEAFLIGRGLELSPEKTLITHIDKGFDFLGQNVRKYGGKLLIKPSRASVRSLLDKVRGIIKSNKSASAGHLVILLNPIIRGWAQYHRHVVSKRVFAYVDHAIFEALWRWCERRHPGKGSRWVQRKYFATVGSDRWVFHGAIKGTRAVPRDVCLYHAASTQIRRHVPIRWEANPYDPAWHDYFARRHQPGGKTVAARGSRTDEL